MSSLESQINAHTVYCREQIELLSAAIEKFPPGRMKCYKSGKYIRYVILIPGRKPIYLRAGDQKTKKIMARKAFYEARLQDLTAELEICMVSLEAGESHPHALECLLEDPNFNSLLTADHPESDLASWMAEDYPRSTSHPEHLIVPTAAGFPVRSKAEAIIIIVLLELKIPFRYEQVYVFNGTRYVPDFTLLHPRTRKIALLEHFGLMDDPDYAGQAFEKLKVYNKNGFRPQKSLLFFFEYEDTPLDINHVHDELVRWMQ